MQKNKECCILWYVDNDKKTFNPGLILTEYATDHEISVLTSKMQDEGRSVNVFTSHVVDCITKLPSLDRMIGEHPWGYKYDPFLIW